jgi:hypothetical protein
MKVKAGDASPTRRTQAERTAATRALLIDSARKLFARKGFGEVSTEVYNQVEQELVADAAARIVAASPVDQLQAMRVGARLFLDLVSAPDVQQIVIIDAPAVLGWEQWRAAGIKYGLGVIEAMLAQAIADAVIPDQPLRPTAHVLLAALDEAALYIGRAADSRHAREEMELVCYRVIAGIAGRDVEALPAVGLNPPRRRP